jgi:Putative virion core protein (lumpy skin disease virus)
VVNEGQCALICESGLVLEAALEPGNYTFSSSESPSIFGSGFEGVKDTFKEMLSRFTYNGVATKNQRVYYVNTKEIMGNLFGTATPIPFRIIDRNIGLDLEASIRCNGEYSFKIVNPLLFYQEVSGNVSTTYTKDQLESQMRSELLTALQPALAKVAASGVRYSEVPAHTMELMDALNEQLNTRWTNLRGIKIVSLAINSLSLSKEDEATIKELQKLLRLKIHHLWLQI